MNSDRHRAPYANYLPIVQSSGTGKSRTVHELARLIFTIPFNFRSDSEMKNGAFAYPFPDRMIRDHLLAAASADSKFETIRIIYMMFLSRLFITTAECIKTNMKMESTQEALATAWRTYLEKEVGGGSTNRNLLYDSVISGLQLQPQQAVLLTASETALKDAKDLISLISTYCRDPFEGRKVSLLLCFDEAHPLANMQVEQDPAHQTLYDVLCSALSELAECSMFSVTLSTNSSLSKFSPSQRIHPSARVQDLDTLQAPWTELPFDCLASSGQPYIRPNEKTLADVSKLDFLVKFGCPLFFSIHDSGALTVRNGLIDLARAKLTRNDPHDQRTPESDHSALACLGARLLLDFEPRRDAARTVEAELVESHMRIAYSIPKHREYLRSGYPSEPILAEAAAVEMDRIRSKRGIPEVLSKFVENGLIDKGERGELAARVLLTEAYDKAVKETLAAPYEKFDSHYSHGVRLLDFLKALFNKEHYEAILRSHSDNESSCGTFEETFKDAYVRFTHFGRHGGKNSPTSFEAWAAAVRAMAIQCSRNQDLIDIVIPIVFYNINLSEETTTAILIQVKNKEDRDILVINETKIGQGAGFFPKPEGTSKDSRPYIVIVMEFGIQTAASKKAYSVGADAATTRTPSKVFVKTRQSKHAHADHPRFSISVTGCSESVYRVVTNKHQYALLLGGQNVIDEHPRQAEGNVAAVRRMKPYWNRGPECYNWIGDSQLRVPLVTKSRVSVAVSEGEGEEEMEMEGEEEMEMEGEEDMEMEGEEGLEDDDDDEEEEEENPFR